MPPPHLALGTPLLGVCCVLSPVPSAWGLKAWRYKDVAEQKKISELEYTECGMSQGQSSEAG